MPTLKWPASCKVITQGYGNKSSRYARGYHTGLDIGCTTGSPVYAAHDGTVIAAGYKGAYGNTVELKANSSFVTSYHHMSRIVARVGQNVSAGTVIGYIGSTGQSTGPHLHFEVRINGKDVDPQKYLNGAEIPAGGDVIQTGITDNIPGLSTVTAVYETLKATAGVFGWLTDTKNWYRIGLALGGAFLMYVAVISLVRSKAMTAIAGDTAQTIKAVGMKVTNRGKG